MRQASSTLCWLLLFLSPVSTSQNTHATMDIVMDKLSLVLLAGISVLAIVHLVLLRKPDPATHPLILGRQSDLDKVHSNIAIQCADGSTFN
jgi:hypothetical protein